MVTKGATADGLGYIVVYELLPGAVTLDYSKPAQFHAVVQILAQLHNANLVQTDVHVNNFVTCEELVYAVDADGLRKGHILRQHFANLALLLAQRPPICDVDLEQIWQLYAHARGEYVQKMGSVENLARLLTKQRQQRIRRYLNKTQRSCTEFVHHREWRRNILCDRDYWPMLQRFMLFPENYIGEGTPLKLGNSATVVRIEIDDQHFVVKRYNIKGIAHRVRRWFKRRGRDAWCNGHLLAFLDIPTARPIALLEKKWGWFVGECYLVMPDVGDKHLLDCVHASPDEYGQFFAATIHILKSLKAAHLQHGDLKATNFVFNDKDLVLIDYDSLTRADNARDLHRFLANWEANPQLKAQWQQHMSEADL